MFLLEYMYQVDFCFNYLTGPVVQLMAKTYGRTRKQYSECTHACMRNYFDLSSSSLVISVASSTSLE